MSPEHRAVIALAEKEGLSPCEKDARLVVHDMVQATRKAMQKYEVGYNKMTEKQQDAVLGDLEAAYKDLSLTVARTIASGGTPSISMTLKDMKISNGTVTGIVDGSDKHFNDLISKVQDKSEVIVVLFERQYADAMDNIQADKDQRSLALDDSKPAKAPKPSTKKADAKPITLTEKQIEDGRQFILEVKKPTVAGMQAQLKFGYDKAIVALELYADEGLITRLGDDKYEMAKADAAIPASTKPGLYGELTYSEVQQVVVLHAQTFELPWLVKRFGIDEDRANHLALELLDDSVIEAVIDLDDEDKRQYSVIAKLEDLVI